MSHTLLEMAKDLVLAQIQVHRLSPEDMHTALQANPKSISHQPKHNSRVTRKGVKPCMYRVSHFIPHLARRMRSSRSCWNSWPWGAGPGEYSRGCSAPTGPHLV